LCTDESGDNDQQVEPHAKYPQPGQHGRSAEHAADRQLRQVDPLVILCCRRPANQQSDQREGGGDGQAGAAQVEPEGDRQ
jgi:hypothetical protein